MAVASTSALVLFAHGARDSQWAEPFRALQKAVSARRPDLAVELAYLEIMGPALGDCVARLASAGHQRIVIAPLFLAQGGHLKKDLPRLLKNLSAKYPGTTISVLPPIGEVTELLNSIAEWLVDNAPR
ncbi:MAG TPA: CbiX/SirB N-terminal domain-containing protein [Burkholderiales bacterium]|nr:CbiX/SirB N-terminal domain-containing protein [Burkholderiales bacterium]